MRNFLIVNAFPNYHMASCAFRVRLHNALLHLYPMCVTQSAACGTVKLESPMESLLGARDWGVILTW